MARKYSGWPRCAAYCDIREVVKMNAPLQIILFLLAVVNLVAISVFIYFRKHNWALGLSILEIIIVYLSISLT